MEHQVNHTQRVSQSQWVRLCLIKVLLFRCEPHKYLKLAFDRFSSRVPLRTREEDE